MCLYWHVQAEPDHSVGVHVRCFLVSLKPIIIDISISHSTSVCRIAILVWRDLGSIRKNDSTVGVVSLVAKVRRLRRKARARDKGRIRLRGRARLLWSRFSVSIRDLLCVFIGARA